MVVVVAVVGLGLVLANAWVVIASVACVASPSIVVVA